MNVILLGLPRTSAPLTKLRPEPRRCWDAVLLDSLGAKQ